MNQPSSSAHGKNSSSWTVPPMFVVSTRASRATFGAAAAPPPAAMTTPSDWWAARSTESSATRQVNSARGPAIVTKVQPPHCSATTIRSPRSGIARWVRQVAAASAAAASVSGSGVAVHVAKAEPTLSRNEGRRSRRHRPALLAPQGGRVHALFLSEEGQVCHRTLRELSRSSPAWLIRQRRDSLPSVG